MEKKTTVTQNALIWFGAGVSIAEILTGTYFAPLGFAKGFAAILIGHIIGCALFFLVGYIGGKTEKSAMESVRLSFGSAGCKFFAALNVLQLLGWTAIMIYDGALSATGAVSIGLWVWCLVIGGLICLWISIGITNLKWFNRIAMTALFLLTLVLCYVIFGSHTGALTAFGEADMLSFGAAIELGVAMPLSWLPLIADYTSTAERPLKATLASTFTYGIVSCWMYMIGMAAAIYTSEGDIVMIMVKAGLGAAALLILVLSTVTTTFLDAWSAGISSESLNKKFKGKTIALIVAILGTIGAIVYPMDNITDFLYLIGSVFAPMAAVQIADFFFVKAKDNASNKTLDGLNAFIWIVGFVLYRFLMTVDTPIGNTLPDIIVVVLLSMLLHKLFPAKR